jgi:hypothetical protein
MGTGKETAAVTGYEETNFIFTEFSFILAIW